MAQSLESLKYCMKKSFAWAAENKVEHSKILDHRLAPDMQGFPFQITSCSNAAKHLLARVAGIEVPTWEDNDVTSEQLQARLQKTIDLLRSVDPKAFDGKEQKEVVFKAGPREIKLTGTTYIQFWAVPNFYFHVVTAYDIMRNAGAPIGKPDYLTAGKPGFPE